MYSTRVILPVFNESLKLPATLQKVQAFATTHPDIAFCFVDDGSQDTTLTFLQTQVGSSNPQITFLSYQTNKGKGHAIAKGFANSQEPFLIFTDGDLAYSLDHIPQLLTNLQRYDVVIGSREITPYQPKNSSVRRKVLGRIFNRLARLITGLNYLDTQAGLKGFRREAAVTIFSRRKISGFGFDVELLFLAHKLAYQVLEIHAIVDDNHSYKISKLKLLRDSLHMFIDLLRIQWHNLLGDYEPTPNEVEQVKQSPS